MMDYPVSSFSGLSPEQKRKAGDREKTILRLRPETPAENSSAATDVNIEIFVVLTIL